MPIEALDQKIAAGEEIKNEAEKIWGGDESEWASWETASPEQKDLDELSYNAEQIKVMLGKETRDAYAAAFAKTYGAMPMPEPGENDLVDFFMKNGGSIYFKRRVFWRRKDIKFEDIKHYYQNRLWEKETIGHALR
ncbi:MAG TPA: hypothetical protein VMD74_04070 [Candidatus Methylomirabilis sp.]|nr:hypothetical protein [Candidatus Methylomirabilis sp.]